MKRQTIFNVAVGSYFSFALGMTIAFLKVGNPLVNSILTSLYWSYLGACLVFLGISLANRKALFPKLTTYFQIWGTLGTFIGLIKMCNSITSAVNASDTSAIRGAIGGFSTALITSLIGMFFALINDMLPEEEENPTEGTPVQTADGQKATPQTMPSMAAPAAQQAVPQTVVFQNVMPPITTTAPVAPQNTTGAKPQNTPGKGGNNNGTP